MLNTAKVPKGFEPIFEKAQEYVAKYFQSHSTDPSTGTIEVFGERYILIRASSISVDFYSTIMELYKNDHPGEAAKFASQILFDVAHSIGKQDAKDFHKKLNLIDPMEKLSVGPVLFSHTGWAFVDIFPESNPSPDEGFYLVYDHIYSFESEAWLEAGKKSTFPVCVMNAGYSSGWCEESFGIPLVASEILCKAKGDKACRFIMAPPFKIEGHITEEITHYTSEQRITRHEYDIPVFWKWKEQDDNLRESEERFRSAFEFSAMGIALMKLDGTCFQANQALCKITGYSEKELIVKKISEITHPDDIAALSEKINNLLSEKAGFYQLEMRLIHQKGQVSWVFPNISLVRDSKGKPLYFIIQLIDINKRKQAEEEAEASRELLAKITQVQNQFIADADPYDIFSKLLESGLSITNSEYGFISEILYDDAGEPYMRGLAFFSNINKIDFQNFIDKNAPPNLEFRNLDNLFGTVIKTGKPVISNDPSNDPYRGKEGPPPGHPPLGSFMGLPLFKGSTLVGIIGMANRVGGYEEGSPNFLEPFLATCANIIEAFRNNQKKKAAEERLKNAQTQLLISQKLAGVGQLAAGVCHEVLNPLNILSIHIQLFLRNKDQNPELKNTVEKMKHEIRRIEKILKSLEHFTQQRNTQAKKIQPALELESALLLFEKDLQNSNIGLVKDFDHELPELWLDPDELRQVLLNLIKNAKHAMTKGGVLSVSAKAHIKKSKQFVRLKFSDTGYGIKKENLDKIFDPFFTTKPVGEGTGMGLAIIHKIIEKNGGTIQVESIEQQGTTFIIDLPVKNVE